MERCTKKKKFSIKEFFSKSGEICNFLQFCSHLLKKSSIENLIFCAVERFLWKSSLVFGRNDFRKKFHYRRLTGFQIHLCKKSSLIPRAVTECGIESKNTSTL